MTITCKAAKAASTIGAIVLFAAMTGCAHLGADGGRDKFVAIGEAVPDAIQEIRYYSTYNFVGDRIDGYERPCALLTKEAANALK